jgi:hypothetical protein
LIGVTCSGLSRSLSTSQGEWTMSHKPPREEMKKALRSPKEKKAARELKKQAGNVVPVAKRPFPAA